MTDVHTPINPMNPNDGARREVYGGDYRTAYAPVAAPLITPARRISWGAVFAGAIVALVTQLGLNLLGLAVGAGTVDPARETNAMQGLGIGAGIWFGASTLIALCIGGFVAARLSGVLRKGDGVMHGLVTWGVVTLVAAWLMGSAIGGLLNLGGRILGSGVSAVGQSVSEKMTEEGGVQELEQQARESPIGQVDIPRERVTQAAQDTAEVVSRGALFAFIALCLGALAATIGGRLGVPRERVVSGGVAKPN